MTQKGYKVLESLINNSFRNFIGSIIIGRDNNVQEDFSDNIIKLCIENNIPYYLRTDYKIFNLTEYSIAISWRWLIKENTKLIVLHDSILPNYRGFAPLVTQLIAKEQIIGVTAIFATNEYDKGAIIGMRKISITYPITINRAIELLSSEYSVLVNSIFSKIENQKPIIEVPQDDNMSSYSLWRDDNDYNIDWSKSANHIKRFIDSVGFPYKGASAIMKNKTIRVFDATEIEDLKIINRDVGKIIFFDNLYPIVVCGEGLLKIQEAIYDESKESIFPLKNFRIRFS